MTIGAHNLRAIVNQASRHVLIGSSLRTVCVHPTSIQASQWPRRAFSATSRADKNLLKTLEERGLVNQLAGDRNDLAHVLSTRPIAAYTGIDPTASSLHLGHLMPLMVLFWLRGYGHHCITLVGSGTASIGDPTGRLTTRDEMGKELHATNTNGITAQLEVLWKHVGASLERWDVKQEIALKSGDKDLGPKEAVLHNLEWLSTTSILDFLKFIGKGARMGTMLGRDTVKNKMAQGDGMSFAEFTYPLLQAWDWWTMYSTRGVSMQIGGSDQYGNIVAGMDAIRYLSDRHPEHNAFGNEKMTPIGLTVPLLTTSSGAKFGKSAGNAMWLDPKLTSSFDLYGFLLKTPDVDIARYLRLFTFLPIANIDEAMNIHLADPGKRTAQHLLAHEVLALTQGESVATETANAHKAMRAPSLASLTSTSNNTPDAKRDGNIVKMSRNEVLGLKMTHVLTSAGIFKSRGEGTRAVASGGVYVGTASGESGMAFSALTGAADETGEKFLIGNKIVVRVGKWKVRVIEVVDQ